MKQYPSRIKYKKNHKVIKNNLLFKEQKVFFLRNGIFGLKSLEYGNLTFAQIEACRKSIRRNIKKKGKILLNTFTYFSKTSKAVGTRMGKGKGSHSNWICPIRKGHILCEISNCSVAMCLKALESARTKLPVKTSIVKLIF